MNYAVVTQIEISKDAKDSNIMRQVFQMVAVKIE